jgi:hypothetical protein
LVVYEDFVETVVLVFVAVVVVVLVPAPTVCVLVFLIKLTPDKRLAFNEAWVRALRAAV